MKEDIKKIVAIYTRVSTVVQAEQGYSLDEQEKRLKAICLAKDYEVYKVYTDEAISGKDIEHRPAYQRMIKDMKEGKFNLIMATKLDRLSRSISDFEEFFDLIEKNDCYLELLTGSIDTSGPTGMLFARILAIFAQFEREIIQERTLIGVEGAVNKGHFGGKPPLGYMHKVVNGTKTKVWEINEDEAEVVREIFNLCLNGKTYAQISNIMNEKYPNLLACNRIDKKTNEKIPIYRNWKDSSISVILNNKRYIGIHEHRKSSKNKETIEIAGKIPPIISEDDFYQCQENIKRNMRNYYRNKNYLFMQKLVCPKCGRTLACNGAKNSEGRTYLYYKCKDCDTYVREELVEQALIDKLNNLLELNNIISDDYVPIDKELAEDFNNCRLNHKLRFAIDERIINDKLKCDGCVELNDIWKLSSYEAKCKFIYEYIDEITVKKFNSKNKKINNVEMLDLKLKSSKIEKLFELSEKGLIDEMFAKGEYKFSKADMKRESDALEYIELLKKKHNISTIELPLEDYDFYWDPSFFKVINIRPVKAIEKRKAIYLYLNDYYEKVL